MSDKNSAIGYFFVLSLVFHLILLIVFGNRIKRKSYEYIIEVDLRPYETQKIKQHRNIPVPRRGPKRAEKMTPLKSGVMDHSLQASMASVKSGGFPERQREPSLIRPEITETASGQIIKASIDFDALKEGVKALSMVTLPPLSEHVPSKTDIIRAYEAMIKSRVSKFHRYPREARLRDCEGIVTVEFLLYRDGRVGDIKVIKGSNFLVLDKAAVETVRAGSPYPPFPPEIEEGSIWVGTKIRYDLDG